MRHYLFPVTAISMSLLGVGSSLYMLLRDMSPWTPYILFREAVVTNRHRTQSRIDPNTMDLRPYVHAGRQAAIEAKAAAQ